MSAATDRLAALAAKHDVPVEALKAALSDEMAARADERKQRRDERLATHAPGPNDRYRLIRNGDYTPQRRPRSHPSDRALVGGALRAWRTALGLTQRQAQQRIGYSASSMTWHNWENGITCPPFRALLLILAASGFGHVADDVRQADADLELDMLAVDTRDRLLAERQQRAAARAARTAEAIRA